MCGTAYYLNKIEMESKPPKIKTDGTANPVTLTLGDKLKIIDELEASAVRNFAETGRKYKVSRPTISKLWKDRESVKKDGLETENKEKEKDLSKKRMLNEDCCLRKGGNHAISGRVWRAQFSPFTAYSIYSLRLFLRERSA